MVQHLHHFQDGLEMLAFKFTSRRLVQTSEIARDADG